MRVMGELGGHLSTTLGSSADEEAAELANERACMLCVNVRACACVCALEK